MVRRSTGLRTRFPHPDCSRKPENDTERLFRAVLTPGGRVTFFIVTAPIREESTSMNTKRAGA